MVGYVFSPVFLMPEILRTGMSEAHVEQMPLPTDRRDASVVHHLCGRGSNICIDEKAPFIWIRKSVVLQL